MVGIVTTKGPCEEVVVKHQGNGHYICTYRIQVRYHGSINDYSPPSGSYKVVRAEMLSEQI